MAGVTIDVVEPQAAQLKDNYDAAIRAVNHEISLVTDAATQQALKNHLLTDDTLKQLNRSKLVDSIKQLQSKVSAAIEAQQFTDADLARKDTLKAAVEKLHSARLQYTQRKLQIISHKKRTQAIKAINNNFELPNGTPEELEQLHAARAKSTSKITGTIDDEVENSLDEFNLIDRLNDKSDHLISNNSERPSSIQYRDNVLYCDDPETMAAAARAKSKGEDGISKFNFATVWMGDDGSFFNVSIEHMLRVGIEDITWSDQIRSNTSTHMSRKQRKRFEQLERFCSASRSAYQNTRENEVYNNNSYSHQVATFLRLTTDEDRRAYLGLLKLDNKEIEKQFIKELNQHDEKFSDGSKQYSPEEYFTKKLAKHPHRVNALKKQIDSLHADDTKKAAAPHTAELKAKATADERFAYFRTIDSKLVKHVWQDLQAFPQLRAEILQRYINQYANATDADKPGIQAQLAHLFKGMNAEEIRQIRANLADAFDGKNVHQNLSLVMVKQLIQKLGGKDYDAVAHSFSPKVFFNKILDVELRKECNLEANTAQDQLVARMRCYQQLMNAGEDKGPTKLKKEITEIIKRFDATEKEVVRECIKDAVKLVFGAGSAVSNDLIEHAEKADASAHTRFGAVGV